MKASIIILSFIIAFTWADETIKPNEKPFQGERSVEFDWQLTKCVLGNQSSNAVISPFSVKILLVLLYEATSDSNVLIPTQTKRELQNVLEQNGDIEATRTLYREWLDSAKVPNEEFDMEIATNLFVEEYIDVITKYRIILDYYYSATVDKVPFSEPKVAAEMINSWVNQTTYGRIPQLVTADDIEGAVIALVNAIFFKGLWTYPFAENGPKLTFHGNENQDEIEFMEQNGQFYYDNSSVLNAQLLRLPYRGDKFAMYIILPHEGNSIDDVLDHITPNILHQALLHMDKIDVNVTIPKFKFDFSKELIQPLQDIGIREIFSQNASLPLLARGKGTRNKLRVSRVFQRVGISINEKGSEPFVVAGADTTSDLVTKFGGDGAHIFNANRPFLFFIEDEDFGTLLFVGRVEDPSK